MKEEQVNLRDIHDADAPKIQKWWSDDETLDLLMSNRVDRRGLSDAFDWIKECNDDNSQFLFGVCYKDSLVGFSRIMYVNNYGGNCMIGILIGDKTFRGCGIGTKSLQATLDFAFNELKMRTIKAEIREDNIASIELFGSVGFQCVGSYSTWQSNLTGEKFRVLSFDKTVKR